MIYAIFERHAAFWFALLYLLVFPAGLFFWMLRAKFKDRLSFVLVALFVGCSVASLYVHASLWVMLGARLRWVVMPAVLLSGYVAARRVRAMRWFSARRVRRELSAPKLASAWKEATRELGAPGAWTIIQRSEAQGMDVRTALLRFESGSLLATIAVHPDTFETGGVWFSPAPADLVNAVAAAESVDQPLAGTEQVRFRSQSIALGTAPFILNGTLTLPTGAGPFPAIVLVHGSGPRDRDETVGPNKPFRDLAEESGSLARASTTNKVI